VTPVTCFFIPGILLLLIKKYAYPVNTAFCLQECHFLSFPNTKTYHKRRLCTGQTPIGVTFFSLPAACYKFGFRTANNLILSPKKTNTMSRLMLPFVLLISHLLLINQTTAARNTDGHTYSKPALLSINTIARTSSDSSPVRFDTPDGHHTVQMIIPTKTVCRQRINTFFIVAIPDTLLDQPITKPAISVTPKLTGATNVQVNNINIGGGADELELLLKTPGRVTNNPGLNGLVSIATVTAYLSRWATSFLGR
jgi:hypothetical protein